jgi:hypothetical protein
MGNKLVEWNNLVARVANVYLQHGPNVFVWSLHKNGIFSVNTIYKFLVNNRIKGGSCGYVKPLQSVWLIDRYMCRLVGYGPFLGFA